ncbi:MAG TPA: thiamine phosphate synthase [candidate division WOR-3 bacterium]|uniref:Thiamine-phosphate synthase n=1 Tax=candidate division WOR-3 bacterium TaxID=2052148 RepID=A0A9C9K090_UNCW3|nr:thiamine phosphate synthase [candidate division WOR-3 bacterium]
MQWERIADVNLNRLDESLKFLEDLIRFELANQKSLDLIRNIRREFLNIKRNLPWFEIIGHRKSQKDPGRHGKFDTRTDSSLKELVIANFTRAKESCRILEELTKSGTLGISRRVKELRFKIYDLEKTVAAILAKQFDPSLYVILDERYLGFHRIEDLVSIFEKNGVTMIQLRAKRLTARKFYNYAVRIKKAIRGDGLKFIINDRTDIALACRAHGVHLGQDDFNARIAREILGENYIIGVSARTTEEAERAVKQGADYLGVGAVFKTVTKADAVVCGLKTLQKICRKVNIPVVAIGGINAGNFQRVLKSGAAGIAVCSYIFDGDIKRKIRALTRKK